MVTSDASSPRPGDVKREHAQHLVTGDRLCVGCGYNLIGQRIAREPHYDLLIVRCPECGTVASVQEYPLLGRWAARWSALLAVVWTIMLVGLWPASSGAMFGWSIVMCEEGSRNFAEYVQRLILEEVQRREAAQAPPGVAAPGIAGNLQWGPDFEEWWQQQNHAALLADAGGFTTIVGWESLWPLIPGTFTMLAVGCFWSVALLHLKRRRLVFVGAAIAALTAIFMAVMLLDLSRDGPSYYWQAAMLEVGPPLLIAGGIFLIIPLALGLAFGRPLLRGAVRLLLPPRLRGSLAILWTSEGLAVPVVGCDHEKSGTTSLK